MLSPKTQYSLKNAREYFSEHLSTGDYYSEGQRTRGEWIGDGSKQLQLLGHVRESEFLSLCENLHPLTGKRLTQRKHHRSERLGATATKKPAGSRRVFYDFTISAPKSVSIAALILGDEGVLNAHARAILGALSELETFASTRVRARGSNGDRRTGNFVVATFTHETSRALDPHLHTHCIVFNATFDPVEKRWKALQNVEMLRAQKYVENVYYHVLARELSTLGYGISNRQRGDFELQGVSQTLCEQFSKRHAEINALTQQLLSRHPEKAGANVAAIREHLAQNKRSRKVRNVDAAQIKTQWMEQLTPADIAALHTIRSNCTSAANSTVPNATAALDAAEGHLFERRSVASEHELWRYALEFGRGGSFGVEELKAESQRRDYIRDATQPGKFTTRRALAIEQRLLALARSGIGHWSPFTETQPFHAGLDSDQNRAVDQIMASRDFITLFRGAAGTGKSRALSHVFQRLQEHGHCVHVIAPQRQQALDLAASGMNGATTLSEFLLCKQLRPGNVIIVDEAGQIGGETMLTLLSEAKEHACRLIISGDTRQHGAVEASDALRAIERHAGLSVAELKRIRRQDPERAGDEAERAFVTGYRDAVEAASRGDCERSFEQLDTIGAIIACAPSTKHEKLAAEYLRCQALGDSALVVAQTWSEIHRLNDAIRTALKDAGHLPAEEQIIKARETIDLSHVQKRDPRFYDSEKLVIFRRNVCGFKRNQTGRIVGFLENSLLVESASRVRDIPFSKLDAMTVYRDRDMSLCIGDQLQLKSNGKTADGRRLTNGELVTVSKISEDGVVHLKDGRALGKGYRDFVRGYAVTSYGSQGKTVDHVLFSDSAVRAATSQQQWYVTISRGRKSIRIFTEDRDGLAENILRTGARELALDIDKPNGTSRAANSERPNRRMSVWETLQRLIGIKRTSKRTSETIKTGETL
jgi:conjugative relaxase-like TrwC/TraI family protein